ncbi:MAG: recombinase family protein [Alphaproteobacteria bacterium]|nr:recombinase family protein [Alphaproteobacteria bacterium]MBL6939416.1 recombinase family protein [Alphaproteobacteria bacterium]MBL7097103.1 recombinase family protein [Alphaproteobacteria bacterium]
MKRAVLYARYSSDLQNPRSVEDQLALCRAHCERNDLAVVGEFSDRAISGASLHGRDGIEQLLAFARARSCDVVVVEALDRVSRDMGDLATVHKQLRFADVGLLTVHDGLADQVQIGLRGLMASMFLTDLAHKVRRGAAGKIRAGQRAGGVAYGYRPVPGKPGESVIHEPEAAIVRRIFAAYGAGDTPRAIAAALNTDGVPAPRGGIWRASTIGGGRRRADGILSNEVYAGTIVWNRVGKRKDPNTGRRVSKPNAPSEWQRADAQHLRIVDEAIWGACAVRRAERSNGPAHNHRKPKRLLSGLIRCGACGSGMSAAGHFRGRPRARCSRFTESGDCTNRRHIPLDMLETGVLDVLREHLKHPELLGAFARAYHEERRKLSAERASARTLNEKRLGEVRRQLKRLIDGVADGALDPAIVGTKMRELEADRLRLEEALEALPMADVVTLHPAAIDRYLRLVDDLAGGLERGEIGDASKAQFRELVKAVVVEPRDPGQPLQFELRGRLAGLFQPWRDHPGHLLGTTLPTRGFR